MGTHTYLLKIFEIHQGIVTFDERLAHVGGRMSNPSLSLNRLHVCETAVALAVPVPATTALQKRALLPSAEELLLLPKQAVTSLQSSIHLLGEGRHNFAFIGNPHFEDVVLGISGFADVSVEDIQ